jgi:hypothetical protein
MARTSKKALHSRNIAQRNLRNIQQGRLADAHTAIAGKLRRAYDRFIKIRGTPRQIASGFALGVFKGKSKTKKEIRQACEENVLKAITEEKVSPFI